MSQKPQLATISLIVCIQQTLYHVVRLEVSKGLMNILESIQTEITTTGLKHRIRPASRNTKFTRFSFDLCSEKPRQGITAASEQRFEYGKKFKSTRKHKTFIFRPFGSGGVRVAATLLLSVLRQLGLQIFMHTLALSYLRR